MDFEKSKKVEMVAERLCEKFGDRTWYELYCKFAYYLPEASIWRHYEKATTASKVREPGRLFSWLCHREMSQASRMGKKY